VLYQSELELPLDVREVLPPTAQDLYRRAFNRAWHTARGRERERELVAHAAAWHSVKQSFRKNRDGEWVMRGGQAVAVDDL
jgi:cation transport regulator